MSGRKLRYVGLVLGLFLLLGLASPAVEAAPRTRAAAPARVGSLEWAWAWIAGWFGGPGRPVSITGKASGGLDPNGRPVSATGDMGPGLDPDGRPVSVAGDASCGIDPLGRCTSVSMDATGGIDPNGGH